MTTIINPQNDKNSYFKNMRGFKFCEHEKCWFLESTLEIKNEIRKLEVYFEKQNMKNLQTVYDNVPIAHKLKQEQFANF